MMASVKNTKKGPPDLEVARHVLANEAAAIRDLAKIIDFLEYSKISNLFSTCV